MRVAVSRSASPVYSRVMKRTMLGFVMLIAVPWPRTAAAQVTPFARDSIAALSVVQAYAHAQAFNDSASLVRALSPRAHIYFVRADTIANLPRDDYVSRFTGSGEGNRETYMGAIGDLVIDGASASATLTIQNARGRARDHLALLRAGGEWRIVAIWVDFTPRK